MKIHVLGGDGVVGYGIRATLAANHDVASFGRESYDDSLDRYSGENLGRCECLVHAAGVTDEEVALDESKAMRRASAAATGLFETAAQSGCTHLVYVSSLHVYGPLINAPGRIDERVCPTPGNAYARCHVATEGALQLGAARHQLHGLVVRPGAVFGFPDPSRRVNRTQLAPYDFPNQLVATQRIVLKTAGSQHRSFSSNLHVGRIVREWLAAASGEPRIEVVNDPGEVTLTVREFADTCAAVYEDVTGTPASVIAPGSPEVDSRAAKLSEIPASLTEFLSTYIRARTVELSPVIR